MSRRLLRASALLASVLVVRSALAQEPAPSQPAPTTIPAEPAPPLPSGQPLPSPEQAQAMLQSRPDLAAKVAARLRASGLTPDQVRARLRAAGYPEDMLDQYLPGGQGVAEGGAPNDSVLGAVRFLGLVDSATYAALRMARDSTPADSLPKENGLPIFGLDVFRRSTSQFEPALAGPVDESYRVGPRDVLVLIITGGVEASYSLEVTREGFIVVPQVGEVHVANLTIGQVYDLLYRRLKQVYSSIGRGPGASTRFSVSVARLHTNQVFVVGEVVAPGSYQVSSAGTVLTALYAAGGPSANGSLRRVEVRRAGQAAGTLDVYDYLLRGDASNDVRLQTGDVIFVPVHGDRVGISGEVVRPASYELKPGETLADLVRMAGGFTAAAAGGRIQVKRILPFGQRGAQGLDRVVIDVKSSELARGVVPAFPLQPGDQVTVFAVTDRERNRVAVLGNVIAPGEQGFVGGMRLSDALRAAGGIRPDTYLDEVVIARTAPDGQRFSIHSAFRDTTGVLMQDVPLQEDDSIQVFSRSAFAPERTVSITGAVRHGGAFPYREGMTLRELVLLAGGVRQSADLREAEIARLPQDRSGGKLAETVRVPLDSTFLMDRAPDGSYSGPPGLPAPGARAPEVVLQPYDNVLILRQPDWELQRTVTVVGDVRFPGTYTLRSREERLSDLFERAGGLTREGNADGVVFYRREGNAGRIAVDVRRVLHDRRVRDNLVLRAGDSIFVPHYIPTVRVYGAVNAPISVAYQPGADLSYYLDAAGGTTRTADRVRAYVTQPNGRVEVYHRRFLLPDGVPQPRAGAVVFVPERDPNDRPNYAAALGTTAQVLASLVAVLAIVSRM